MKINYQDTKIAASEINEKNDCAVKAVSIVARVDYFKAHSLLKQLGRKNRKATKFTQTIAALNLLGMSVTEVKGDRQSNGSKYTPKTIGDKLKKGYYLCRTRGHVFAMVNGQVCDWTENRNHHIKSIFRVTKTRS